MVVAQARHRKKPAGKTAKRAPSSSGAPTLWQRHERDIWIVALIVAGLFVLLAEAGALGPIGRAMSKVLALLFGVGRMALPVILLGDVYKRQTPHERVRPGGESDHDVVAWHPGERHGRTAQHDLVH